MQTFAVNVNGTGDSEGVWRWTLGALERILYSLQEEPHV